MGEAILAANRPMRTVNDALALIGGTSFLQRRAWMAAGVYTFTVEKSGLHVIEVCGAGGGRVASNYTGDLGGGGAYVLGVESLVKGDTYTVTVGAPNLTSGAAGTGIGGSSSFGSLLTAPGGGVQTGGVASGGIFRVDGGFGIYTNSQYFTGGSFLSSSGGQPKGPGVGGWNITASAQDANKNATPGCVIVTWA